MKTHKENAPPPFHAKKKKVQKQKKRWISSVIYICVWMCQNSNEKSSIIIFKPYTVYIYIYLSQIKIIKQSYSGR